MEKDFAKQKGFSKQNQIQILGQFKGEEK